MSAQLNVIELTRQLVRMNTVNPPGQEEQCARHLGSLLEKNGFHTRYHDLAPGRASLVATIGGRADKAPLCFTGHIDTVPLGAAKWNMDPFGADTESGKLYGRGTSDMKCGVAAFVVASLNLAPSLERSPGLVLVITAGEETGCEGAFHLAHQTGALGRAGAVVVGEPSSNYPFVGHRGAFWLNARTRGVTAHGSMPEKGDNAVFKAARAVAVLEKFRFKNPPHPLMGQATLNVGTIRGGLNINSVPDEAVIGIDIRTIPNVTHAALKAELMRQLGNEVELETLLDLESVFTEPTNPWIQEVFVVMRSILGRACEPRVATYFTDAAALNIAYNLPPTVILGPGEAQMAHQTNEYCVIDRVTEAVAAYEEIARRWCAI
ncbi:MAG TPA: M20 family metallopeptidase [Burkholderiales bacterium]|nr:M20 family metallopeptidase [Burkholderiales bacterium]